MKLKEFKANWVGRKYKCRVTGVIVELTDVLVFPRAMISVGNGAIDLGDGFYSRRIGNLEEVKEISISEFISNRKEELNKFGADWLQNAKNNPDNWPLFMERGDWDEQESLTPHKQCDNML